MESTVSDIVGRDSVYFKDKIAILMDKRKKLCLNTDIECLNENDKHTIGTELISNIPQLNAINLITRLKTRGEVGDNDCIKRCAQARDSDIEFANRMTICATAVNTFSCLATAGASGLAWWIAEFGIAYVHDETIKKAWADYYTCIADCPKK